MRLVTGGDTSKYAGILVIVGSFLWILITWMSSFCKYLFSYTGMISAFSCIIYILKNVQEEKRKKMNWGIKQVLILSSYFHLLHISYLEFFRLWYIYQYIYSTDHRFLFQYCYGNIFFLKFILYYFKEYWLKRVIFMHSLQYSYNTFENELYKRII